MVLMPDRMARAGVARRLKSGGAKRRPASTVGIGGVLAEDRRILLSKRYSWKSETMADK